MFDNEASNLGQVELHNEDTSASYTVPAEVLT